MSKRVGGEKRLRRLEDLTKRDGPCCYYCGIGFEFGAADVTIDEVVPLGRGGLARVENQVLACYPCNQDKKDMTGEEYAAKLNGGSLRSYVAYRIELKNRQRGIPPPPTPPRVQVKNRYSGFTLAEVWPA